MWPGLSLRLQSKDEHIVQLKNQENLWINHTCSNIILMDNDSLINLIIENSHYNLNIQAKSVPVFKISWIFRIFFKVNLKFSFIKEYLYAYNSILKLLIVLVI